MSRPSFERIDYRLRPAKSVMRKMLSESLSCLAKLSPLSRYRYVGFGSVGFYDFRLFHRSLGIGDMVSIECEERARARIRFNRPYACIKLKWGLASTVLPALDWKKRTIIWLDYDKPLDNEKLLDISTVVSSLSSGSAFVVTVSAHPQEGNGNSAIAEERLTTFKSRVGAARAPLSLRGADLAGWGLALATRTVVDDQIRTTLIDRNGSLDDRERLHYDQLFHIQYSDSAKMLTVGGVFCNESDRMMLTRKSFRGLEFVSHDEKPFRIENPVLTLREIRYLDRLLPNKIGALRRQTTWLPALDREKYAKVYRYYPTFAEIEA